MKDFTLAAVILFLALCLFDAAQLTSRYATALVGCANGIGFTIGNVIVACTPIEIPRKEATAKRT